jgi:four helix bundle protein
MEKSHKRLEVWQKSIQLTKVVYEVTSKLPADEKFGLVSQMRRAAVSIPSNIAEGSARQTNKDALHFFAIARGSLSELDTQENKLQPIQHEIDNVDLLLSELIRYRKSKTR